MNAIRKNISIHPAVLERAGDLMKERAITNFSELLATLIREDYDRRKPKPAMEERVRLVEEELRTGLRRERAHAPTGSKESRRTARSS